jgi:hypothetical protein
MATFRVHLKEKMGYFTSICETELVLGMRRGICKQKPVSDQRDEQANDLDISGSTLKTAFKQFVQGKAWRYLFKYSKHLPVTLILRTQWTRNVGFPVGRLGGLSADKFETRPLSGNA